MKNFFCFQKKRIFPTNQKQHFWWNSNMKHDVCLFSLRSLFRWGHFLFAYVVWSHDFETSVKLWFHIFPCVFEGWETKLWLQNLNTAKNDEKIAPQVTLILAIWNLEKYFLLSKRKLNQINRSWLQISKCKHFSF